MCKRAVILAGGRGTRLRPYTVVLPKPLMPIGEFPILEVIIRQLTLNGFNHITLAVNHQAEIIKAYFQNGSKWGIKIDYSLENTTLSTMGPLKLIQDLPENFLVMNGDVLTDLNYADLYTEHLSIGKIFTISAQTREHKLDFGVLEADDKGNLAVFKEKPTSKYNVSMGIYVANRRIINFIPEGRSYGFDNLMIDLLKAGQEVSIRNFLGYWRDIGRPDDYSDAIEEFESMRKRFLNE